MSDTKKKKKEKIELLEEEPKVKKTSKKKEEKVELLEEEVSTKKNQKKNSSSKKKTDDSSEAEKSEEERIDQKIKSLVKEYLPYVIILILILLFKKFLYAPIYVHGDSMYGTLHDGDIMVLDIVGYRHAGINRFDIVVVDIEKELIIKRVIGLPGEEIEYKDNQLYVNGKEANDIYGSNATEDFKTVVPKGKFFVLGDNRQNSMDSRYFGAFSEKEIMGRTQLVLYPFNRFGNKD